MTLKVVFNPFTTKFDYIDVTDTSAFAPATPTLVASGATFTVPANTQVLYGVPVRNDGALVVDGALVDVSE